MNCKAQTPDSKTFGCSGVSVPQSLNVDIPGFMSVDDYVKQAFPEPKEDSKDYPFFKQWGYEQWLIKTRQQDFDGLKILLREDYENYCLHKLLFESMPSDELLKVSELAKDINKEEDTDKRKSLISEQNAIILKRFVGNPLVKSRKIIRKFLGGAVPKDTYGLALYYNEGADKIFAIFPPTSPMGRLNTEFGDADIELTDKVFENIEQLYTMVPNKLVSMAMARNRVVNIPDKGVYFVENVWNDGIRSLSGTFIGQKMVLDEKKKKYVKEDKTLKPRDFERIQITEEELQEIEILLWSLKG